MDILSRDSLTEGGFSGLREYRLVTDYRVFGKHQSAKTWDGLGQFIYLADARFNPMGETGMHFHKEIDVISVMVEGRVVHEGTLEHGQQLIAGDVQVQRAGGKGFSHNEVNPDSQKNRMIQLWALPEREGEAENYMKFSITGYGITRVYGGNRNQPDTIDSNTTIDILRMRKGESTSLSGESLSYLIEGKAVIQEDDEQADVKEGDLIRSINRRITATSDINLIVIST